MKNITLFKILISLSTLVILSLIVFQHHRQFHLRKKQMELLQEIQHLVRAESIFSEDFLVFLRKFYNHTQGIEKAITNKDDTLLFELLSYTINKNLIFERERDVIFFNNILNYLLRIKFLGSPEDIIRLDLLLQNRNLYFPPERERTENEILAGLEQQWLEMKNEVAEENVSGSKKLETLLDTFLENYLQKIKERRNIEFLFYLTLEIFIAFAFVIFFFFTKTKMKKEKEYITTIETQNKDLQRVMQTIQLLLQNFGKWDFSIPEENRDLELQHKDVYKIYFLFLKSIIRFNMMIIQFKLQTQFQVDTAYSIQEFFKSIFKLYEEFTLSYQENSKQFLFIFDTLYKNLEKLDKNYIKLDEEKDKINNEISDIEVYLSNYYKTKDKFSYLIEKLSELKQNSNKISDIVKTIQNITEKTNMLALNASIEAARAGEFGKGFNIVAEEITKLAEQNRISAKTIQGILTGFEESIKKLEEEGTLVTREVGLLSAKITQIGEFLKDITRYLQDMTNLIVSLKSEFQEVYHASNVLKEKNQKEYESNERMFSRIKDFEVVLFFLYDYLEQNKNIISSIKTLSDFKFSKTFSVNIELMDAHHNELFTIFSELLKLPEDMQNWKKKYEVIRKRLLDYANYHFKEEEGIMEKYGYPDLENHKKAHGKFMEIIQQKELNNLSELFHYVVFLFDWLIDHIFYIDKRYSEFFAKQGILEAIQNENREQG